MRILAISITAMALISTGAIGQDISPEAFDARGYVADLNAVSENWHEGELTNSDIVIIAAVGCSTLHKIKADDLMGHAARWINAVGYPEPNLIENTQMQDFITFEVDAFKEAGATDATLNLLDKALRERAILPVEAPSFELMLNGAEEQYCGARLLNGADPGAPASEAQVVLAGSVVDSAVGASMIAVDAVISTGSAGADAGFIAILSGGVGYDLLKRGLGG